MNLLLLLLSLLVFSFSAEINPIGFRREIGQCEIRGTENDPTIRGSALFVRTGNRIEMTLNLQGITVNPGRQHGVHIHKYGDITSPTGLSTSTHFNPHNQPHGCPPKTGRHVGDTGNWNVTLDGKIQQSKTLNLLRLSGPFSIIGRALIIHAGTDDCMNETSAGQRIAQCVVGIANPNLTNPSVRTRNHAAPGLATNKAVCVLQPTFASAVNGLVLFEEGANGTVTVKARVHNLTGNSIHGFHIHEFGDLRSPFGIATGEHWNPFRSHHSIPPLLPRHLGDMGNIYYYEGETAYYLNNFTNFELKGIVKNAIGHAVIVHAGADDCSDPSGNSGARLAQCVIGYANPTTTLEPPSSVPTKQDTRACSKGQQVAN